MPFYEEFSKANLQEERKEKKIAIRLKLYGKVQNVGCRNWLKKKAKELKLDGWVRNKASDKSVEVYVLGPNSKVKEFVRKCYVGPPFAVVRKVSEFPERPTRIPPGFQLLPSSM